jgi:hypothetical protein
VEEKTGGGGNKKESLHPHFNENVQVCSFVTARFRLRSFYTAQENPTFCPFLYSQDLSSQKMGVP